MLYEITTLDDLSALADPAAALAELDAQLSDLWQYRARLHVVATAAARADEAAAVVLDAMGLLDGRPWIQPTGAHNAYPVDRECVHGGRRWRSNTPANVWEPGVLPGLWTDLGPADGSTPAPTAPAWVEGVAYVVDQLVTYGGVVYRCTLAHTAYVGSGWTPAVSASLWTAV